MPGVSDVGRETHDVYVNGELVGQVAWTMGRWESFYRGRPLAGSEETRGAAEARVFHAHAGLR